MNRYAELYQGFYNSSEWKELRKQVLVDSCYLCSECKKQGKIKEANTVHHVVPIEEDWSKRLDYNNCIAVCGSKKKNKNRKKEDQEENCHNRLHERRSGLQRFMEERNAE